VTVLRRVETMWTGEGHTPDYSRLKHRLHAEAVGVWPSRRRCAIGVGDHDAWHEADWPVER
jgi:hypothetical protein